MSTTRPPCPPFDRLLAHDAAGEPVQILELSYGKLARVLTGWSTADGASAELVLPETATGLVVYRKDEEVDRRPLELDPGAVTGIRP